MTLRIDRTFDEVNQSLQRLSEALDAEKTSKMFHEIAHDYQAKKSKMEWLRQESKMRVLDMERQLEIAKSEWNQVDQNKFDHEAHAQYTKEQDKSLFSLQTELKQSQLEYDALIKEKESLNIQLREVQVQLEQMPPVSEKVHALSCYHGLGLHFYPDDENHDSLSQIPVRILKTRNPLAKETTIYHVQPEDDLETVREIIWSNI